MDSFKLKQATNKYSSKNPLLFFTSPEALRKIEDAVQRHYKKMNKKDRKVMKEIREIEEKIIAIGGEEAYKKSEIREMPAYSLEQILSEKKDFLVKLENA